jgi:hypothetical protein
LQPEDAPCHGDNIGQYSEDESGNTQRGKTGIRATRTTTITNSEAASTRKEKEQKQLQQLHPESLLVWHLGLGETTHFTGLQWTK